MKWMLTNLALSSIIIVFFFIHYYNATHSHSTHPQDQLYYCALSSPPSSNKLLLRNKHNQKIPVICFCIDSTLVYWNFFLDFGPLNLGQLYRFRAKLNDLLRQAERTTVTSHGEKPAILFYSSNHPAKRTNAVYLICAWQVLELNRTPEQAFLGFSYYNTGGGPNKHPLPPTAQSCSLPPAYPLSPIGQMTVARLPTFHDASPVQCHYNLNIMHCLYAIIKAKQFKFFDFDTFNVQEYEYYEQVEVSNYCENAPARGKKVQTHIYLYHFVSLLRMEI